ncbi:hypothetical protein D9758_016511 [Tetrapyrgos nigripes]|uniref:HAT C-terminal dimerisation domain-containing protein n=1 Tax=Tetrapyrgos nigripes TaxID=182062 RepID=A0A8H5CL37_9AGAR|nr:hypothetical protein D9758_016511 [Tetrapyrgos nigripes]
MPPKRKKNNSRATTEENAAPHPRPRPRPRLQSTTQKDAQTRTVTFALSPEDNRAVTPETPTRSQHSQQPAHQGILEMPETPTRPQHGQQSRNALEEALATSDDEPENELHTPHRRSQCTPKGPAQLDPLLDPPQLRTPRGRRRQPDPDPDTPARLQLRPGPARTPARCHPHPRSVPPADEEDIQQALDSLSPMSTPASTIRLHPSDIATAVTTTPRAGPHSKPQHSAKKTRQKKPKANDVWPFFNIEEHTQKRICTICSHTASTTGGDPPDPFSANTSTGTLRKHLYTSHLSFWIQSCDRLNISIMAREARTYVESYCADPANPGEHIPRQVYSRDAFRDAICEFIISDDQAINAIENPKLRAIFLMLKKDLEDSDIPRRHEIRRRILELWEEHLDNLTAEFENALSKISFTSDMWTNSNMTPFLAVTAHWIETKSNPKDKNRLKLNLRAELIGFHRVPGRHDGDHLGRAMLYVFDPPHFQLIQLGYGTLDAAGNNDTALEYVERDLQFRGITWSKRQSRIWCFPHSVNRACQDVINALTDLSFADETSLDYDPDVSIRRDLIANLRTVIRMIRASSQRRDFFSECLAYIQMIDMELLRDVKNRWSSVLLMLLRAILLKEAIKRMISLHNDLKKYWMNDEEWNKLERYAEILQVPHSFQERLSGEKTPTLSFALPGYDAMIAKWEHMKGTLPQYASVIDAGIAKLHKYRDRADESDAYTLAMIVNPSIKLDWFKRFAPHRLDEAKELFLRELESYTNVASDCQQTVTLSDLSNDDWADAILGLPTKDKQVISRISQAHQDEVNSYFSDKLAEPKQDELAYWEDNQARFPTIFRLALDILPIQASSVPCERVFSSSSDTDTKKRNRISPELNEALQMLKYTLRRGNSISFTAGTSPEEELATLKELLAEKSDELEDKGVSVKTLLEMWTREDEKQQ